MSDSVLKESESAYTRSGGINPICVYLGTSNR
jgi:hypothetical protein